MPYKDLRVRKDYENKLYLMKKKKLLRKCPKCKIRDCSFGETCRACCKEGQGITWARKIVLARDDHTCQVCGLREVGIMDIDHIISIRARPDLYTDVNNMMVLCPNCHRRKTVRERKVYDSYTNPPSVPS